MKILITGGLGYIGSHIAYQLKDRGVIIDNQSNSKLNYKKYLPKNIVYNKDINYKNLKKIFTNHNISCVIHLAGYKSVYQSTVNPLEYYSNNLNSSIELLNAMRKFDINKLIFSSSAVVYGNKQKCPLKEDMNLISLNPYASTKIMIEQLINDYSKSNPKFKAISLRYFNPVGSNTKSGLRDQPLGEPQNLIPILINSILKNKKLKIFGSDYNTPDGTCIRDYIHVNDLASAHLNSLKKINRLKGHTIINIGLGRGLSVLDVIKTFEKVNNVKINYSFSKRRNGDAAISFADNKKAKTILNWQPSISYEKMFKDAWNTLLKNK